MGGERRRRMGSVGSPEGGMLAGLGGGEEEVARGGGLWFDMIICL